MALIEIKELHIHEHIDAGEIRSALASIDAKVTALQTQGVSEMATLKDVQDAVAAEKTVTDSAVALLNGLAAQVAALTPDQAAIDQLAADIKAQTDALAAAVTADTPAAPGAGPA